MIYAEVVLKLFHLEDPQIDTHQPTDPQLKKYARDPHIREAFYCSNCSVIFKHFHFRDPQFDMHYSLGTSV